MRQSGITLIELLVTVALIAIMATIGMPNFQSLLGSNRFAGDYNELMAHLHFGRSEAVKRRSDIAVNVSSSGGVWKVEVRDEDNILLRETSGRDGQVSVASGSVSFNALGRRTGCTGEWDGTTCSVMVTSNSRSGSITITATGRIE
ncbi:GspH/FimT family pseudopilin [Halomonas rhizosphaerae]|uniref:GspH/FimT family pseudopilin n=1 Tax=Halomonas rhizosphaerae TaxID=3043296 RepID=UPI0038993DE0